MTKKLGLTTQAALLKWLEKVPSSQRFWVLTGSVALLTGALAMQLIYNPATLKQKRILARLQQEEEKLSILRSIASREKELKQFSSQVIQEGDAQTMIQRVTQLASQSGLTLLSAQPKVSPSLGLYGQVQVDVTARGTFKTLRTFLATLQNQEPYLEVGRLEVKNTLESRGEAAMGRFPLTGQESFGDSFVPPETMGKKQDLLSTLNSDEIEISTTIEGWIRRLGAAS